MIMDMDLLRGEKIMYQIIKLYRNERGGYSAVISCKGGYFYADLSPVPLGRNEIMIFKAHNPEGEVSDWGNPVYTEYPESISEDVFKGYIDAFVITQTE